MKKTTCFPILFSVALTLLLGACGSGNTSEGLTGRVTLEGYEGRQVYLETTTSTPVRVDSTKVIDGRFTLTFTDSVPQVYSLVLSSSPTDAYPIVLPVVSEKGHVNVSVGELVLTSGTPLNDRLQDFLLEVSRFTDNAMKQENPDMQRIKEDFARLVEEAALRNADTPVGVYIYRMYADRLDESKRQNILTRGGDEFKRAVEK